MHLLNPILIAANTLPMAEFPFRPATMVKFLLLFPVLAAAILPLLGRVLRPVLGSGSPEEVRFVALMATIFNFAASLYMATGMDLRASGYQLTGHRFWVPGFGIEVGWGLDAISLWLVLLTTFLMPLIVLGSYTAVKERHKEFYGWLLLLETAMIGTFVATDLIFFYVCFEFTLVPLYFLIGIFGSTQRLRAARVFFLYTFTGSMLTFAGVLYVAWFNVSLDPRHIWTFDIQTLVRAAHQMTLEQQTWVLLAMLAGFAVKVPIFPVHTWLPLAHTEAPTAGSVILAGVLLKLGTYGLLRFAIPFTLTAAGNVPGAAVHAAPWIATLAIIGILYTALICWVQRDIKKLIAYSSVSHLGFCVLGLFALNTIGISGAVMYMINHGLSTGALFLCVGMIYERFHTREMAQMGGLAKAMPVWAFFFVFFCLASVGLPGLNGFVGEFLTLLGAFGSNNDKFVLGPKFAAVAGVGMILGAIYLLYMVGRVVWGPLRIPSHDTHGSTPPASVAAASHAAHGHSIPGEHSAGTHVDDLSWREIAVLVPLAVACLWLGLLPTGMLRTLEPPIRQTILSIAPTMERVAAVPAIDTNTVPKSPSATADHARAEIQSETDAR